MIGKGICIILMQLFLSINTVNQNTMQTNKWSQAATNGVLLALITIIITLILTVFKPGTAINLILWAVKLIASIWLLYYFVKEYAKDKETFSYKEGFVFGIMVSFFSSLVCAAYMFMHYAVIFPESVAEQMETAMQMMQSSNSEMYDAFEKVQGILPQLVFIFSLIYYTIIGVIASSIIANSTKKTDLFTETNV